MLVRDVGEAVVDMLDVKFALDTQLISSPISDNNPVPSPSIVSATSGAQILENTTEYVASPSVISATSETQTLVEVTDKKNDDVPVPVDFG